MKAKYFFYFLVMVSLRISAQDQPEIVVVEGENQTLWEQDKESKQVAKDRAEKFARVNALEKAFGTVIVQGNSTYIRNINTGQQVETKTSFNMIGNTTVSGEIIEVLKIEFTESQSSYKKGKEKITENYIQCIIKAKAKKLSDLAIDFEALPLRSNQKNAASDRFTDGNDMFFYFKSPVSGYLSIYIDISGKNLTQRILPYTQVPAKFENGMPVEADKEYIFFSKAKEHDYYNQDYVVADEIYVSAEEDQEMWRFFIIFSKDPLNKPSLKEGLNSETLTEYEKKSKCTVPKALESEEFQRWMIQNLSIRNDFQRKIIDILVQKKK
jgi:hypothetical protein